MVSFRELYGFLTADQLAEIEKMKQEVEARSVDRENAEAELFGESRSVVAVATPGELDEEEALRGSAHKRRDQELLKRVYSKEEMERGVVFNAAVFLEDPSRMEQTMAELQKAGERDGLPLKAVSWQKAAGFIGQLVALARLVLLFAVSIIFVVTMVIINNSMMMATLQRIREIGTLRAIGAQRGFVLAMVLAETLLLGLVFGSAGALVGGGLMGLAGKNGIPAPDDVFYFFFSGPRLYPTSGLGTLLGAVVVILLISAVSTFYPAFLATRVSPVKAMQTDE
jgi:ABC-type lipoprotein release transport system permease subunit